MKKIIILLTPIFLFLGLSINISSARAQGMMGQVNNTNTITVAATAKDEADGKAVWEKLQSNKLACKDISDDEFDVLGDYYMGQNLGSTESHDAMNIRMKNMMGEEAEKQMHIFWQATKWLRHELSIPANGSTYLPMMGFGNMMNNGWGNNNQGGFVSMMGFNGTNPIFSQATWFLALLFLALGIIYFWKGINKKK
jgi:preprotein translocase subunit SecG